jgi:hypothetical protein
VEPGQDRLRGNEGRLRTGEQRDGSGAVGAAQRGEPAAVVHYAVAAPLEHDEVDRQTGGKQSTSGVDAEIDEVGLDDLQARPLGIGQDGLLDPLVAPARSVGVDPPTRGDEHSTWTAVPDLGAERPDQRRGAGGHGGGRRVQTALRTQSGAGLGEPGCHRVAAEPCAVVELEQAWSTLLDKEVGTGIPGELRGHQRTIGIHQLELVGKAECAVQFAQCCGTATARLDGQLQQPGREPFETTVGPFFDDHRPEWLPAPAVPFLASEAPPSGR